MFHLLIKNVIYIGGIYVFKAFGYFNFDQMNKYKVTSSQHIDWKEAKPVPLKLTNYCVILLV